MYDFDTPVSRKGTSCYKWDFADSHFGGTQLLPMWIADMDFEAAPQIKAKIKSLAEGHPVFGYGALSQDYYRTVQDWMERRHGYHVEKDWIVVTPGVVLALCIAVQTLTEPQDEVMVLTPVYSPFYHAIEDHNRVAVRCPMKSEDGYYTMDFECMEQMITPKTKALMFCSPQNPTGRVWDQSELEQLALFCEKHSLLIINDEIHHDLVFDKKHIVLNKLSSYIKEHSVLCTAPSKTFNLAGVEASNIIIPNPELRARFRQFMSKNHMGMAHCFTETVVRAAYEDSEDWLDELLVYIKGNIDYFVNEIQEKLPTLKVRKPEGTYLVWVDFGPLGMTPEETKKFLIETCHLALNDGCEYGQEGNGFFRFNMACPRVYVEEAVKRLVENCKQI